MIVHITDDFNPDKIADSGQCFRWTKTDDHTYRIIAGKFCLYITELADDSYDFSCSEEEYNNFWMDYFDLKEDYRSIRERIDPDQDPFLQKAAESEQGIRILRQDPWEMLITFIISQNKNIPAIRRCVELLVETCGERKTDIQGRDYCAFPTPAAISTLPESDLASCKLGYRSKYIRAVSESVLNKEINLSQLANANEKTTISELTRLYGVGVKVANCVSLFGLHHIDAFPIDVWIKRILELEYPSGYPYEKYSPYNGIYQQYMFAYYRHFHSGRNVDQKDERII